MLTMVLPRNSGTKDIPRLSKLPECQVATICGESIVWNPPFHWLPQSVVARIWSQAPVGTSYAN
jgi:hypothetical protein